MINKGGEADITDRNTYNKGHRNVTSSHVRGIGRYNIAVYGRGGRGGARVFSLTQYACYYVKPSIK